MRRTDLRPTGVERFFEEEEIIVSKTDPGGKITYANAVFARVAGYSEQELLGAPHSLVRHPDMPRVVFKRLWETITKGREIFAYVVNLARTGDHYWVFAHVTPTFDAAGKIVGFHSNRRCPNRTALGVIEPLYRDLVRLEAGANDRAGGLAASEAAVERLLAERGIEWDALMFALQTNSNRTREAA